VANRNNGKRERYLAIETSSPRLSLAIGDGTQVLSVYSGPHDWRHAESLFQGIERLLYRLRWPIGSLTGVAVSIGPGSFTGIRIGLAAARALGQALQIPVVGVSSLEIMAAGARTRARWLAPQIDALRGQVFSALYKRDESRRLHRVRPEIMISSIAWPKEVKKRIGRAPVWISPAQGCYPEAKTLLKLAQGQLAKAGPNSYRSVLPLYIRQAAAQERQK
jgi:tRNA threonylcarbamoyladenosine biosynthesis protein TsaB